jgi:ABC-type amino acid transport substrate-binding protein/CheY-like chemotaxis protein/signal transduction histidine kinase
MRIRFVKYLLFLASVVLLTPLNMAQSDDKLLVGTDYAYYPYEYVNEFHQAEGFDIDIISAIALEIKRDVEFRPGNWSNVKSDLEEGRTDIIAGMYYLPDRAERVNFSMPYIIVTHSIFVKAGDYLASLKDVKDQEDLNVVVENSSILHAYLTTAGISASRIIPVENQLDALKILSETSNTCALLPTLQGQFIARRNGFVDVNIVGLPILPREYAVAINKSDTLLLSQINDAITTIHKNGIYEKIYNKWFGQYEKHQNAQPIISITEIILLLFLVLFLGAAAFVISKLKTKKDELATEVQTLENENDRINQLLHKNENSLRKATENTPFPLAIISSSGNFVYVNRIFEDEFGYTQRDINNLKNWLRLFFPNLTEQNKIQERLEEILSHMALDLDYKTTTCDIIPFLDAQKNRKYFNLYVVSLGEGQILFLFNNITTVINTEDKLHSIISQTESKDHYVVNYLSNLGHDFKIPVNDIVGYASLLVNDEIPKTEIKTIAQLIKRNGESMAEIINNIIDFSKVESGKLGLLHQTSDIGEIFNDIYQQILAMPLVQEIPSLNLNLNLPVSGNNRPFLVNLDKTRFKRVISSILYQIIHSENHQDVEFGFFNHNPEVIRVFIKTSRTKPSPQKSLNDDYQKDNNKSREIGLTLTAELTRILGYELKIKTDVNDGYFIYLDLKLVPAETPNQSTTESLLVVDDPDEVEWPHKTILLVEDNMENSNYVEAILGKMKCTIITKESGRDAIEVLKKNFPIDLIILDWMLPDISGQEVAGFARLNRPSIPIIVVSAMEKSDLANLKTFENISYFIEKPVNRRLLIKNLLKIFGE